MHHLKIKLVLQGNTTLFIDFSASEISTDGSLILLEKLEYGHKLIKKFGQTFLKRITIKIWTTYPEVEIVIRTDSGFSCVPFYELVNQYGLLFVNRQASNAVLKRKVLRA
ncbi:hypothetical protein [Flavicella sp.]|uniref:hypothetical protein n=1 Tax=Flavicella sp. TaxID=2957742 RepID=UPI00301624E2